MEREAPSLYPSPGTGGGGSRGVVPGGGPGGVPEGGTPASEKQNRVFRVSKFAQKTATSKNKLFEAFYGFLASPMLIHKQFETQNGLPGCTFLVFLRIENAS